MRRFFSTLLIGLLAFTIAGCEKPTNEEPATGGVSFTFGEPSVTANSIEVSITPSDNEINYFATIVAASTLEGKENATIIDEFLNSSNFRVRKGVQLIGAKDLLPETEYAVVAFAITETEKLTRLNVKTEATAEPIPADQFDVTIEISNITATSATAKATPNSSANRYYFRVITKMELDAFGIYNDDFQIFEYIIENPSSGEYITSGTTTRQCQLSAEMDYLAVAFNFENWEAVHNGEEKIKLFRKAFTTPEAPAVDPNELFTYSNLQTTHTGFSVDVVPTKGEDSFWGYYVWTKKSFDETLANEAKANIVMRSYFGLNNIGVEQGYDFGTFMKEYMGQTGSSTVINYEPLHNNTEYVLVLFYLDPEVSDPTAVYDYNYVAINIKTNAPTSGEEASLLVSEPVITANGFKYDISFLVKTNNNAVDLLVGAQLWNNYDFAKYWDPNDWSQIQAFFMFRKSVSADTLEIAKSDEGATISFTGFDKDDYVFFFEALNKENTATQFAIRVTPDMFE